MSETLRHRVTDSRALALALARWTALLMGWVWLGAQGQRLGRSLARGVLGALALITLLAVLTRQIAQHARSTQPWTPRTGDAS